VSYTGTGSSATIAFAMDTSTVYSSIPLYLSCMVPSTAASGTTCAVT
jgi:hypothetical protein